MESWSPLKRDQKIYATKDSKGRINALLRSKKSDVLYASTAAGEMVVVNLGDQQVATVNYSTKESLSALYEDKTGGVWIAPEKERAPFVLIRKTAPFSCFR